MLDHVTLPVDRKSKHDLGNHHVTTAQWGYLYPIYWKPVSPRETVEYTPNVLIQSETFKTITFGRMKVSVHSFFVPCRVLWEHFNDFISGGSTGVMTFQKPATTVGSLLARMACERANNAPDDAPLFQFLTSHTPVEGVYQSLYSKYFSSTPPNYWLPRGYFSDLFTNFGLNLFPTKYDEYVQSDGGLAPLASQDKPLDLLPFRAYQQIWWDWYRDSTLVPESLKSYFISRSDGLFRYDEATSYSTYTTNIIASNNVEMNVLKPRFVSYDKDYFTTARTEPQQGSVSLVPVSLGTELNPTLKNPSNAFNPIYLQPNSNDVYVTGSTSEANDVIGQFAIETFRASNALQRFRERNNVLGSRPIAQLLGRFGIAPSAARLDMAEFLGGDDHYIDPSMVVQTAETAERALGDRAAFGKVFFTGKTIEYKNAEEHGIFLTLLSVTPVTEYCDGIDRSWTMFDKEDYFLPEYENLGFEAIFNSELAWNIMLNPTAADGGNDEAFGFVPRYSYLKWRRSVLAGDFVRPDSNVGADAWHTFRRFTQNSSEDFPHPTLNEDFVTVTPNDYWNNWNRLFINTTQDYEPFMIDIWNNNDAILPMEGFAEPALANVYEMDGSTVRVPYGGIRLS